MLKAILSLGVLLNVGVCGDENVPQYLLDVVNTFSSPFENVSENCRRDLNEYAKGILNKENWALTMIDSMEKFPTGLLLGRTTAPGQFEECLSAVHPNFTGQHCTVDITMKTSNGATIPGMLTSSGSRSIGSAERIVNREFGYGVCIPSTCDSSDLKAVIAEIGLNKFLNSRVSEDDCFKTPYQEFRVKDYLALTLLLFVVLLALLGTVYELCYTESTGTQGMILKSFSLHSNFNSLFHINRKFSEMDALNGMRFLSTAWVILGHYLYNDYAFGDTFNNIEKFGVLDRVSAIPMTNAFPSVDSFFFLSGLLVCFVFFRDITAKGSFDFPVTVLRRYIRLTAPLAAVMLIHFTIFSRMISAPFSKIQLEQMESGCRDYWWAYFLYIQNFYHEARKCVPPGWYLGTDMQLYLISPLVMYVLLLWPKFAPKYIGMLVIVSPFISFAVTYVSDLAPNHIIELFKGMRNLEYFYFYTRMTPWIVGVATGYILCGMQAKKIIFRPAKVWIALGWLTCAFLCLASLYGIAAFLPISTEHSTFKKSTYRAFHRLGWALGLSWITIACAGGYGGIINAFLSLTIFQPLGKLSYCMYLTHHVVQKYRYFQFSRHSERADIHATMHSFLSDVIITIAISIPTTLLFEMPFAHLSKIFLQNVEIFPFPKGQKNSKPKQLDLEKGVGSMK